MSLLWANEFAEIPDALRNNVRIREWVLRLVSEQPIPGKVTEGSPRLATFREILAALAHGRMDLRAAIHQTEVELCPETSAHATNNRVFCYQWAERLIRTQLSRFYNQAVMELLLAEGESEVFVPHSSQEDSNSQCSEFLAGKVQSLRTLYLRLTESYAAGHWNSDVKIPDHPHCTHVVKPLPTSKVAKLL